MNKQQINPSSIVIRKMISSDHDEVKTLSKQMHETLRRVYRPSESARSINSNPTPFTRIVAILDEKVVGMATYEQESDSLYFGSLGVLKEYKKQGVARELIEFIETVTRKLELSKITCSTVLETGNETIFQRLGFKTMSIHKTTKFISNTDKQIIHEVHFEKIII